MSDDPATAHFKAQVKQATPETQCEVQAGTAQRPEFPTAAQLAELEEALPPPRADYLPDF